MCEILFFISVFWKSCILCPGIYENYFCPKQSKMNNFWGSMCSTWGLADLYETDYKTLWTSKLKPNFFQTDDSQSGWKCVTCWPEFHRCRFSRRLSSGVCQFCLNESQWLIGGDHPSQFSQNCLSLCLLFAIIIYNSFYLQMCPNLDNKLHGHSMMQCRILSKL